MPPQLIAPLRDLVLGRQKQGLVIGGPIYGSDSLCGIGQCAAGAQIFELKRVLAEADVVDRVSQKILIVADNERAQARVSLPFGELVEVEQHLFSCFHGAFTAALDRILLAFLGAGIVEIAAAEGRNAEIGLLDAREHLFVKSVAERLETLRHAIRVRVLRREIPSYLGIRLLPQPKIIVDNRDAVPDLAMFDSRSGGRSCKA